MGLGLHEQSLPLVDTMWEDAVAASGDTPPPLEMAVPYLNALLDAGKYDKAIEIFEPLMKKYPADHNLMYMMIEAYRALGRGDQADQLAQRLVADIESQKAGTQPTLSDAAELAWLYTVFYPKADQALTYARQVAEVGGNAPIVRRLLGAAEILSGQPDLVSTGRDRLERSKANDPLAAAVLAEYYMANDNETAAMEAIAATVNAGYYSGWAYHHVRDLAAKKNLTIPSNPQAEGVRKIFEEFDKRYLDMGRHPEKYLSVAMRAMTDPWRPGEGVEIEATLTNQGDVPVPLGPWGLIEPTMNLEAVAPALTKERFTNLPMVVWPAPKYLAPGASVRAVVRLDVGSLEYFLARHPLDEVTLTVTATLDPVQQGRKTLSAAPNVQIEPLTLRQRSLLDLERGPALPPDQAYPYALRVIMTDLVRGALPRRMRAARQLGELVTLAREVQLYMARLPEPLKGVFNKAVLLAMVQKTLQDPSEAVRAEMLAALDQAQLDETLAAVLLPAAQDASPLVRFRLVELLGICEASKQEKTLQQLSQDTDPLVRQMALAFGYGSFVGKSGEAGPGEAGPGKAGPGEKSP